MLGVFLKIAFLFIKHKICIYFYYLFLEYTLPYFLFSQLWERDHKNDPASSSFDIRITEPPIEDN